MLVKGARYLTRKRNKSFWCLLKEKIVSKHCNLEGQRQQSFLLCFEVEIEGYSKTLLLNLKMDEPLRTLFQIRKC